MTRQVLIELENEEADSSWAMLLVPAGSTDVQVIQWAARFLPPQRLAVLRSAIEAAE